MIKRIHRYLGLACAIFWLVQATTGMMIMFRWEIDDATLVGASVPVDPNALAARTEALARTGSTLSSMWASGGAEGRFDIFHESGGVDHVTRVDGSGRVLRDRGDEPIASGGMWDSLTRIHQSLMAGDTGAWIVGVSGILLLTNLALGLRIAWPRGSLARVLTRKPAGQPLAQTYGWHRLLGLWVGIPAMVSVSAGVLLVFVGGVERNLGAELVPLSQPGAVTTSRHVGVADAIGGALARHPGAVLSGISFPSEEDRTYTIRLNLPGETRRIYGATTVVMSAADGQILLDHDARRSGWRRSFVETLYPFHTGQVAGVPGRLMLLGVGIWLITMIVLGLRLWWLRMSAARRPRAGQRRG